MVASIAIATAQMETQPTENPLLSFFGKPYDPPDNGSVGAFNPTTGDVSWVKDMGRSGLFKIFPSPDGKVLLILSGDRYPDMAFPTKENTQNTVYLVSGKDGTVLSQSNPLLDNPRTIWAETAWQNLTPGFKDGAFTLTGELFSNPNHPQHVPFSVIIPLPAES